jgi:phosphate-selective porin O/P
MRFATLAACALLVTTAASAQNTPASSKSDPPPDSPPVRVGPLIIAGYIQADALAVTDDEFDEFNDGFRIRRARLSTTGDLLPKIGFAISVDMSNASVSLRDAYATVRFADQFQVRIGQFYPAMGLERLTSTSRLEVIDRTRLTDLVTYERNPGVAVLNARPYKGWLSYNVGAFNGSGMNRTDDNDAKDIVGRVVVTPPMLPGIAIGAGGGGGEQLLGTRKRMGADVVFDRGGAIKLAVEGLRETFERLPDRSGFYVLGAYRIRPAKVTPHFRMVEFAARYLQIDDAIASRPETPTQSAVPVVTKETQFGGNYYVNRIIRFMANAIVPLDDRETMTFIARFQFGF